MPGLTLLSNDMNLPVLKEPCVGVDDERLGDVLELLKLAGGHNDCEVGELVKDVVDDFV